LILIFVQIGADGKTLNKKTHCRPQNHHINNKRYAESGKRGDQEA
jgi:hypothetical protein